MYADLVEIGSKRSIKDRLYGNLDDDDFARSRPSSSKRLRQSDDTWKHDLYEDRESPNISTRVGAGDLRLKLLKKSRQQAYQGGKESGVRDLREKLSGTMQPPRTATALPKAKVAPKSARPVRNSVPSVEETIPETKKVSASSSRKKSQRKVPSRSDDDGEQSSRKDACLSDSSMHVFLKSLGLEKYLITLQVEEVDMTALRSMKEEDLRTLGIPMGPRKKILLALDAKA